MKEPSRALEQPLRALAAGSLRRTLPLIFDDFTHQTGIPVEAGFGPSGLLRQKIGPNERHLHLSLDHHLDFLAAVRNRTRPASDAAIGYRSITVCHLGNIAYQLNRPLKWDAEKEAFVKDPEADRLLWREMRPPYGI